jgi:hypothetical protein
MKNLNEIGGDKVMTTRISNGSILIDIPIELLKWTQEQREDRLKIHNKKNMSEWVRDNILDWGGNDDIGSTAFEDFIDAMFIEALEWGEEWLDADWKEL